MAADRGRFSLGRNQSMTDHLMDTYARLPVSFVRGEGAWLIDADDRRYLDTVTGIGVCSLGHAHPEIAEVLCDQSRTLIHTGNVARVPLQEALAERLCGLTGMERAFFCNSGAEANECALKIARRHGHERDIESPEVVVAEGSFHGRTLATLSASGSRKVQAGFEPLVPGFVRVPFGDAAAMESVARNSPNVVAVLVEPIQGEGGVVLPPPGYLQQLREICDANDWLLVLDEIQTGVGKTGAWYACQHENVRPDVITTAKALGNGVPIGACLGRGDAAAALVPGKHGSTFGGNPLACRAALKVLEIMERDGIPARAARLGQRLQERLADDLENVESVRAVRGKGLMVAVELNEPCAALKSMALERGLLLNITRERVVRLLPPLILSDGELETLCSKLVEVIREFDQAA